MVNLENKIAVITGAATGIGQTIAEKLAQCGADIALVDINPTDETAARVAAHGRKAVSFLCDVSAEEAVAKLKIQFLEHFSRCDILVNNAGIYPLNAFEDISFALWKKIFAVNVDSQFLMAANFIPLMKQQQWGRVINLTSSSVAMNIERYVHYISSKMANIGFTRALASEYGKYGITVNAISPSLVKTDTSAHSELKDMFEFLPQTLQAIKRLSEPGDLAGAAAFLASDAAAFITGQTLAVDGGLTR